MMEVREDGRSARSEDAQEAAAAGYTSLGCTRGRASVGKVSALLSLQLRVQCLESAERRERKSPKSRRSAPRSLLGAPAPLSLASRMML